MILSAAVVISIVFIGIFIVVSLGRESPSAAILRTSAQATREPSTTTSESIQVISGQKEHAQESGPPMVANQDPSMASKLPLFSELMSRLDNSSRITIAVLAFAAGILTGMLIYYFCGFITGYVAYAPKPPISSGSFSKLCDALRVFLMVHEWELHYIVSSMLILISIISFKRFFQIDLLGIILPLMASAINDLSVKSQAWLETQFSNSSSSGK